MTSEHTEPNPTPPRGKTRKTAARGKSKRESMIDMLSRKSGADVAAISERLGWQPHTTRAALSRLRKAGYEVLSEKSGNGKPARYRITATPAG